jgi:multidrug resistance efflux pump
MEADMRVYKSQVFDRISDIGAYIFRDQGDVVDVAGNQYVQCGNHMLRLDDSWHETQEAADMVAADKIEEFAIALMKQAASLRGEVAHATA